MSTNGRETQRDCTAAAQGVPAAKTLKTLKLRVKDKHASVLAKMAREVNTVWNFVNETSSRAIRERQQFMSAYDLQKYTAGYSKCDGVLIQGATADAVCEQYVTRRRQFKRTKLRWRVSNPASRKRSLGWIPLKAVSIKYVSGQVRYAGHMFSLWDSYGLAGYELRSVSFNQDARGRWYFNVTVEVQVAPTAGTTAVGIDLGLKTAATASDGQKFDGRLYRASEQKLAVAQRAGKKRRVTAIHAKIKNQRKDGLHKFSTSLVRENAAVFVGDVPSAKLVKTRMAKSTLDAGWSMFKTMLEYKCRQAGVVFEVVNERYSTQTCSQCGSVEGPKGVAGLSERSWQCSCGAVHDRDVNAARNIRRIGLDALAGGALASAGEQSTLAIQGPRRVTSASFPATRCSWTARKPRTSAHRLRTLQARWRWRNLADRQGADTCPVTSQAEGESLLAQAFAALSRLITRAGTGQPRRGAAASWISFTVVTK